MKKRCDLHTHSSFSDGTFTPARLIRLAEEAGLAAVALCDHNTIDGLPDFLAAAENSTVRAVPGIEFSAKCETEEHILGYYIGIDHPVFSSALTNILRAREQRNIETAEKIQKLGFDISEVIVAEDSLHCIETAKNAGFATIAVYDEIAGEDWKKILEISDYSVDSMEKFCDIFFKEV